MQRRWVLRRCAQCSVCPIGQVWPSRPTQTRRAPCRARPYSQMRWSGGSCERRTHWQGRCDPLLPRSYRQGHLDTFLHMFHHVLVRTPHYGPPSPSEHLFFLPILRLTTECHMRHAIDFYRDQTCRVGNIQLVTGRDMHRVDLGQVCFDHIFHWPAQRLGKKLLWECWTFSIASTYRRCMASCL